MDVWRSIKTEIPLKGNVFIFFPKQKKYDSMNEIKHISDGAELLQNRLCWSKMSRMALVMYFSPFRTNVYLQ